MKEAGHGGNFSKSIIEWSIWERFEAHYEGRGIVIDLSWDIWAFLSGKAAGISPRGWGMVKQGENESVRRGGASLRNGFFFKLDVNQQTEKGKEGKDDHVKIVRIVTCRTSSEGTSCNDNNSCLCWENWSMVTLLLDPPCLYPRLCCICLPSNKDVLRFKAFGVKWMAKVEISSRGRFQDEWW